MFETLLPVIKSSDFQLEASSEDQAFDTRLEESVRSIINQVRKKGDSAVRDFTEQFDGQKLERSRIDKQILKKSLDDTKSEIRKIFEQAIQNINRYHEKQLPQSWSFQREDGTELAQLVRPIERTGAYIPGGKAVYPSTVLMNLIPAKIAGVPSIMLCSPPCEEGLPARHILACCALLEIDEVHAIGGVQAIAAMAYGTESLKPVKKITGPGNAYVAEAKRQVFGKVGIDSIAGPSEVTILHHQCEVSPDWVARDLLAQAEHDELAKVFLLTTSFSFAEEVSSAVSRFFAVSNRKNILSESLRQFSKIVVLNDLEEGIQLTNSLAPEHLQLLVSDEEAALAKITNAGAIFSGKWSPTVSGDYFAGPNHTLPTGGGACFSSALSVADFLKRSSFVRYTETGFRRDAPSITTFADLEGLGEHAKSAEIRIS